MLDYIEYNRITPSHSQALSLKDMSENNNFTVEKMESILNESKPNEIPKLKVSMNRLIPVLLINAVIWFGRHQKRKRAKKEQVR